MAKQQQSNPKPPQKDALKGAPNSKKRKDVPTLGSDKNTSNKKPKFNDHRSKQRDARTLSTQTTSKAFKNGELDVDAFVRARDFEMRALEGGLARSKKALNRRAFQQVPKDLRRRTASHNVKRMPKRLRERGKKEMAEDNTPTVTSRRRKPTKHMRLRLETAKKLRALGSKRKAEKEKAKEGQVTVTDSNAAPADTTKSAGPQSTTEIKTRPPKVKKRPKAALATPPVPKAKFRKRQIHKAWLPTHLFHAKRAHMTPPSAPLWQFSIPLTPTAKCYRPTHRASHERGAVAWDTSYMSTVSLEGREDSVLGVLRALGVEEVQLSGRKGEKWRLGISSLETFVYEREEPKGLIAPVAIVWCAGTEHDKKRKVFVRVHPSAFFQLWEEVVRLGKVAKPAVTIEDLRFEIGSVEITGPGATEALLGALWPARPVQPGKAAESSETTADAMDIDQPTSQPTSQPTADTTWTSLAGLTNPALLPANALLSFNIQDPRVHHPPRTITLPKDSTQLMHVLSTWTISTSTSPASLFSRKARQTASRLLPSQKSINRRKGLAPPGQYPATTAKDPQIPILLFTSASQSNRRSQGRWTLLLPWKCVAPVWYSLLYYPLSTGGQPRFGGLDQERQIAFEKGEAFFPADFPGTKAGWEWELSERAKREKEWERKPKGKRVSWEKLDLGDGKIGEFAVGWRCDWERLLQGPPQTTMDEAKTNAEATTDDNATTAAKPTDPPPTPILPALSHLPATLAHALLSPKYPDSAPSLPKNAFLTICLTLLTRGVPQTCARIYRLPTPPPQRQAWLSLLTPRPKGPKNSLPRPRPKSEAPHVYQQRLAASLLSVPQAGAEAYPACPGEEDLIGFVTTGNFNLAEGKGTGVASLLLERVMDGAREKGEEGRVCVVRNAGEMVGRLARWDVI